MAGPPVPEPHAETRRETSVGHEPYVPDDVVVQEFTWPAVLVGAVLGIVFGASSLYLVLKVGMTVSASIPVAVLSITLSRLFSRIFGFRRATILENNIVQTTGSAGESIAFGVGVTMPALMLLGFEMEIGRVMVVSVLGGALGILMMIPLRRAFIVKKHGVLKYPEGTACADVLIVGEQGGASAKTVFAGFGIALVYQFLWRGLNLWKEVAAKPLSWFQGAVPSLEANPTLLGVGYIIGTRVSCIMVAGGVLAYLVLVPAIHFFGDSLSAPVFPGTSLIRDMDEEAMRNAYVLYVGAGAVATGGIISLFQALPLIVGSLQAGLRDLRATADQGASGRVGAVLRTDRDLSIRVVGIGSLLLVLVIWATLPLGTLFGWVNLVAALLIVLFGFLFVTVSSRLTGEIGSSSNPISGMTVATLLLTCLIFLVLGWTDPEHRLVALSVAAIVCIASSNGGTTSQDLKTGFLVGATPKYQQLSILVGSISSALVIGCFLILFNDAGMVYTTKDLPTSQRPLDAARLPDLEKGPGGVLYHVWRPTEGNEQGVPQGKYLVDDGGKIHYLVDPGINGRVSRRDDGTEVQKYTAPKARLMALITGGILEQKLPWTLVLLGVGIALVLELSGVPSLPFAVGVYLPLSSSTPIFVGGLIRYLADRWGRNSSGRPRTEGESEMSPGVLLSTGYIAGGAIGGVLIALLTVVSDQVPKAAGIPKALSVWQYRQFRLTKAAPAEEYYSSLAAHESGPGASPQDIAKLAQEIKSLNESQLPRYVAVPKRTALKLPGNETYRVEQQTTLGEVARELTGSADRASPLFDLNKDQLKLPEVLPVGAALKVPQHNVPALTAFSVLVLLLAAVGLGWLLKSPAPATTSARSSTRQQPQNVDSPDSKEPRA